MVICVRIVVQSKRARLSAPEDTFPVPASRSHWREAWRRLRRNRAATTGLLVIACFYFIALCAPLLAPHDPLKQNYANTLQQGVWATNDWRFILGTDDLGRDVLSRLLHGARVSMTIGLVPITLMLIIGGLLGMTAGVSGGAVDNLLMRLADVMYAFPQLLWLIIVTVAFRDSWLGAQMSGLLLLFVALAVTGWEGMARLVRGQVLQMREKEFILAAQMVGVGYARLAVHHILPNILAPIIVSVAFSIPGAIMGEAGLSFLGLGIKSPAPSWGSMIADGQKLLFAQPALMLAPACCLAILMLACAFLGDGLRDALDPQMK
jgi:oligopeptide transport system permease protein